MSVAIEGAAALQLIAQMGAATIAKHWNGSMEVVPFILEKGPNQLEVKFAPSRPMAIVNLRNLALALPPPVDAVARAVADELERAPPPEGLECVIVGWGSVHVVHMNPDDLRAMRERPHQPAELNAFVARVVLAAQTRESALQALRELTGVMQRRGEPAPELSALERAIEERWDDAAELAMLAARAANAIAPVPGELSERTTVHLALTMMADAFGNRAAPVTGSGGDA